MKKNWFILLLEWCIILISVLHIGMLAIAITEIVSSTYPSFCPFFVNMMQSIIDFSYQGNPQNQDSLRSALLVIWTFITLAISYFAQRIDNTIFGVNIGSIYFYALPPICGPVLLICFSLEIFVLLFSVPFNLGATLMILAVILMLNSILALLFITYGTSTNRIMEMFDIVLKRVIRIQWKHKDMADEKNFLFTRLFRHFVQSMNSILQVNLRFVEDRFLNALQTMTKTSGGKCWDSQYDAFCIMIKKLQSSDEGLQLLWNLVERIDSSEIPVGDMNESDKLQNLTVLAASLVYTSENLETDFPYFLSRLSFTASFQPLLTVRCIAYSLLTETSTQEGRYKAEILSQSLPPIFPDNIIEGAFQYWLDASGMFPGSMLDVTELLCAYNYILTGRWITGAENSDSMLV